MAIPGQNNMRIWRLRLFLALTSLVHVCGNTRHEPRHEDQLEDLCASSRREASSSRSGCRYQRVPATHLMESTRQLPSGRLLALDDQALDARQPRSLEGLGSADVFLGCGRPVSTFATSSEVYRSRHRPSLRTRSLTHRIVRSFVLRTKHVPRTPQFGGFW